ncbi:MAG: hypothetical protein ABF811_09265 [Pseudoclavibacter sp.]
MFADQSNSDEDLDSDLNVERMADWERRVEAVIENTLAMYYPEYSGH